MASFMDYVSNALRGKGNPDNPKLKPIEGRRQGYSLYVKESRALGETPKSYEEWIKEQG